MKLKELKEKTNNLTDFEAFKIISKSVNPITINKLPQEWKNHIFIEKAKEIHGNKYNYSLVNYIGSHDKVTIICKIHGEFEQTPNGHLISGGCSKCGKINRDKINSLTTDEFMNRAIYIHSSKYCYSKVIYINNYTKVDIICPTHGNFKQTPNDHLKSHGCPRCRESKGEIAIAKFLDKHKIKYEREYIFKKLGSLRFDFYLPDLNTCIEFDGIQHFVPINYWGGEEAFKKTQKNDRIKNEFCEDNNIKLIRIKYTNYNNIEEMMMFFIK